LETISPLVINKTKAVFLTSIKLVGSEQTSWTTFAFLATLMQDRP